jgi:hypothetical protein
MLSNDSKIIADKLRRLADWLDAHPESAGNVLSADADYYRTPRILLYRLTTLAACGVTDIQATRDRGGTFFTAEQDGIDLRVFERDQDRCEQAEKEPAIC